MLRISGCGTGSSRKMLMEIFCQIMRRKLVNLEFRYVLGVKKLGITVHLDKRRLNYIQSKINKNALKKGHVFRIYNNNYILDRPR